MKFAITLFTLLLGVVGGMLFVQYQGYTTLDQSTAEDYRYSQEIEIVYRNNSLDVRQHFKNLPSAELEIEWPTKAVQADCFLETENSCSRLTEDRMKFKKGENRSQSISYVIPLNKPLNKSVMLRDIFVTLKNGEVNYSTLHITTDPVVKGSWVTGLPYIGKQTLALVNYSMFSGEGAVKDLYYSANAITPQYQSVQLTFFGKTPLKAETKKKLEKFNYISDDHVAIVESTNGGQAGYRIWFTTPFSASDMAYKTTLTQLHLNYTFENTPSWVRSVVASFLTNEPVGNAKAKQVVEEITNHLDEEQLADWKKRLQALEGKTITLEVLDQQLSAAIGIYTKYISINTMTKNVFPFVYNDQRAITVNGKEKKDVYIIFADGLVLYPADALLQHLGYKTSVGPNGYYVTNATKSFRFPDSKFGFYVYNQQRYNVANNPIQEIAGMRFIEESWVKKLFSASIVKEEKGIAITTTIAEE